MFNRMLILTVNMVVLSMEQLQIKTHLVISNKHYLDV